MIRLPIEDILGPRFADPPSAGTIVGRSRQDRPIVGHVLGNGDLRVSLIAGCHADEPVGPSMLERLVRFLQAQGRQSPYLRRCRWLIVPHANPDGVARNAAWSDRTLVIRDHLGEQDRGYDPVLYVQHVARELPGDDMEFGFPRSLGDLAARPENRALAAFLTAEAPFRLHASLHGMGFAPGPWFLLEPAWVDRTAELRRVLRDRVRSMGYPLFDVDRQGEKGFRRVDEGFSTRPDSRAMAAHFRDRGDSATADRFRPSSMEFVRRLGGDPLTLVSEMPLFLMLPDGRAESSQFRPGTDGKHELHDRLRRLAADRSLEDARGELARLGIHPMPIRDQMRLQLAFLDEALVCVATAAASGAS